MVVICLPSATLTGTEHERTAIPSRCTVQSAALSDTAPVLGAGQSDAVPQHPQERGVGIGIDIV